MPAAKLREHLDSAVSRAGTARPAGPEAVGAPRDRDAWNQPGAAAVG